MPKCFKLYEPIIPVLVGEPSHSLFINTLAKIGYGQQGVNKCAIKAGRYGWEMQLIGTNISARLPSYKEGAPGQLLVKPRFGPLRNQRDSEAFGRDMKPENLQAGPDILDAPTGLAVPAFVVEEWAVAPCGGGVLRSSARNGYELASELRTCFPSESIEILVARLDVGPEIIPALIGLLDDAECERASRFVFERDRFRFIVGRARLRQALSARLGVRPEAVEFVYGKHGKPALARPYANSNLRFNVSHSEDLAVYAFTYGREIGVDIEAVRVMSDGDDIAARFFSVRENEIYHGLQTHDKPLGFFNCWTRKEAFIKALGEGLYHPLDSFDVSLAPGEPAKILRVGNTPGDECGWRLNSFPPARGFVAALVCECRESRVNFAASSSDLSVATRAA